MIEKMLPAQEDALYQMLLEKIKGLDLRAHEADQILLNQDELLNDLEIELRSLAIPDRRFGAPVSDFELVIPDTYDHDSWIDNYKKSKDQLETHVMHRKAMQNAYTFPEGFDGKSFSQASVRLQPGQVCNVRIFPMVGDVTIPECLAFLTTQHTTLVNGQGLTLAQDLYPEKFPEDSGRVFSFDVRQSLPWFEKNNQPSVLDLRRNFAPNYNHESWAYSLIDVSMTAVLPRGSYVIAFIMK